MLKNLNVIRLGLTLSLASTLALFGCGGGGGGTADSGSATLPSSSPAIFATSVTTLAGGGVQAVNATGASASFYHPMGVTADSSGNVYVADAGNSQIRKISPSGAVTLLAGSRTRGAADGAGSAASFRSPFGVAVDSSGSVYVADTGNHLIRKITAAGVVSTIAGNGFSSAINGVGTAAGFSQPEGIAVDGSGNVYVSETGNSQIRKITSAGVVTTLAGSYSVRGSSDGTGASASFNNPKGLTVDLSGNVYVADTNNQAIRKVTPAGIVTTVMSGSSIGSVSNVAVDNTGNLYISDHSTGAVRKLSFPGPASSLIVDVGVLRNLPGFNSASQTTNKPFGIAVNSSGTLYVADTWNNQVHSVNTSTGLVSLLAGSPSYGSIDGLGIAAKFNRPNGIVSDSSGNLFVADTANCSIRKITTSGVTTTFAGSPACGLVDGTGSSAAFLWPLGMAIDSSNNIYVTDGTSIRKITPAGLVATLAGSARSGAADGTGSSASFASPVGIGVDRSGNIYVADQFRIRKITAEGVVSTFAGSLNYGTLDGAGDAARFDLLSGLVVDSGGYVFVSEFKGLIRKVTPAGVVTTFAGGASSSGSTLLDGTGSSAKFLVPLGLAIDTQDNVYVADSYNNSIRKITPSAVVTTIAGFPLDYSVGGFPGGNLGNLDGAGNQATFFNPTGVTVGRDGSIFVSDTWNDQIRKITR